MSRQEINVKKATDKLYELREAIPTQELYDCLKAVINALADECHANRTAPEQLATKEVKTPECLIGAQGMYIRDASKPSKAQECECGNQFYTKNARPELPSIQDIERIIGSYIQWSANSKMHSIYGDHVKECATAILQLLEKKERI